MLLDAVARFHGFPPNWSTRPRPIGADPRLASRHSRWIISRLETDRLARVSWVRIMLVTLGVRGLSLLRRVGARLPDVRGWSMCNSIDREQAHTAR
jgi:hypothetical protein